MKRVFRIERKGKMKDVGRRGLDTLPEADRLDARVAVIQALIPVGLEAVAEELQAEVLRLAGPKHQRLGGVPGAVRWGHQRGSIYLADQKLPITYQRVRDLPRNRELPLPTYQRFQQPRAADAGLFRKVLVGLSCREYEACAEAVPEAFGPLRRRGPDPRRQDLRRRQHGDRAGHHPDGRKGDPRFRADGHRQ